MTLDNPSTSGGTFLAVGVAPSEHERSLHDLIKAWRGTRRECEALFKAGKRPEASMDEVDPIAGMNVATEAVAHAPARSLAEMALKAEVAAYWLDLNGGLEAAEAALAEEWDAKRYALRLVALLILRDLLRLCSSEQNPLG